MVKKMGQGMRASKFGEVSKRTYVSPKLLEYGKLADLTEGTYTYGYRDQNAGSYYPTFFGPKQ
ncbi:MAG: hypothetical protein ACPLRM_08980 [Anaerolineae bacterium]